MNIVVAVRCMNEERNIERFMRGYDFADKIIVSDGGSTDNSVEMLEQYPKVIVVHFDQIEETNGVRWNKDAPHMNFVLDKAKELDPNWLIFDDMDCIPNKNLRDDARDVFHFCDGLGVYQVNAFRLYLWNDNQYFPKMNNDFDKNYKSLWAWKPSKVNIRADESIHHGTLIGTTTNWGLNIPLCLLHKSWDEQTIDDKIKRYKAMGIEFNRPFEFAGNPTELPSWAHE